MDSSFASQQTISSAENHEQNITRSRGNLRALRNRLGLTLEDVGRRTGRSRQHVQQLEEYDAAGRGTITTLNKTANALGHEVVVTFVPKGGA
jgi:transcriptional regulator with XRE-family HTH domain